jgi:hypothetical protein
MTPEAPLPPKPPSPEPGDCCGGGCARCVFDVYEEELAHWEREVEALLRQREQSREENRHP